MDLPEGSRPSIGEAFEVPYQPMDVPRELKGKLDKMTVGSYVLYATDKLNKKCRVGLILSVHRAEQCIVVHRLEPCSNASLRVRWLKVYLDGEGKESTTPGAKPSTARLAMSEVLEVVTISRDGVLNARATRRFSNQDWTYDSSKVEGADTRRSEGLTGLSALQTAERMQGHAALRLSPKRRQLARTTQRRP